MAHRIVRDEADRIDLHRMIDSLALPFTAEWSLGADRSLEQNRLQWLWANEASQQLGDSTASEVRERWKLHYGVPILREDSDAFRAVYDRVLKPLGYEDKLRVMQFLPITSDMKVRQMVRYLDAVERECAEQGIRLTQPDPDLAKYHARYRAKPEAQAA